MSSLAANLTQNLSPSELTFSRIVETAYKASERFIEGIVVGWPSKTPIKTYISWLGASTRLPANYILGLLCHLSRSNSYPEPLTLRIDLFPHRARRHRRNTSPPRYRSWLAAAQPPQKPGFDAKGAPNGGPADCGTGLCYVTFAKCILRIARSPYY